MNLSNNSSEQQYAIIQKVFGGGKVEIFCVDGQTRLGRVRGKIRSKVLIRRFDVVLVSLREFQNVCVCMYVCISDKRQSALIQSASRNYPVKKRIAK